MAKAGKGEAEEGEGGEGEKKKGVKGLIIKIVPLVLIAFVVAKMTVLKPPPPTAAQAKAKAEATKYEIDTKCALANGMKPPKAPPATDTAAKKTTPTTVAKAELAGPVLDLDSKTLNL